MQLERTWGRRWGLILGAGLATACSAADPGADDAPGCAPGEVIQCVCPDTTAATQSCLADGRAFGPCGCSGVVQGAYGTPGPNGYPSADPAANPNDPAGVTPTDPANPDPTTPLDPAPTATTAPTDPPPPDPVPPAPTGDAVPATPHCAAVAAWDPVWQQWEEEVLLIVNQNRAAGAACPSGPKSAVGPLTMNPNLRCAARLHSKDMSDRGFFDHVSPDGGTMQTRVSAAGYSGGMMGENIANGYRSPSEVVAGWMSSTSGHCDNIMDGGFTEIGIGYFEGPASGWTPGTYWTQNFGGPGGGWRF